MPIPNSTIQLLKGVPFDSSYKDVRLFDSVSQRDSYFATKVARTFQDYTYQRHESGAVNSGYSSAHTVKVGVNADSIRNCNYLRFQNTNYSNRWFYAFIKQVNYINSDTTEIIYEIDYFQSYFLDVELGACILERRHFTQKEDTNIGYIERVTPDVQHTPNTFECRWNLNGNKTTVKPLINFDLYTKCIVVQTTTWRSFRGEEEGVQIEHDISEAHWKDELNQDRVQDFSSCQKILQDEGKDFGIFSQGWAFEFHAEPPIGDTSPKFNDFIAWINYAFAENPITGIYYSPMTFEQAKSFNQANNNLKLVDSINAYSRKFYYYSGGVPYIVDYPTRNLILKNAPYHLWSVTSSTGGAVSFNPAQSTIINYSMKYNPLPGGTIVLETYSNTARESSSGKPWKTEKENAWNNHIELQVQYPLPFEKDSYNAAMTTLQNEYNAKHQQATQQGLVNTLVSTATGAITGGIAGAAAGGIGAIPGAIIGAGGGLFKGLSDASSTLQSLEQDFEFNSAMAQSLVNTALGSQSAVNPGYLCNEVNFYLYSIVPNYQKLVSLDLYYDSYGYKINWYMNELQKDKIMHNRVNWDFVKTKTCNIISGEIPDSVKNVICAIFDRGVKLWHKDPSSVGEYDFNYPIDWTTPEDDPEPGPEPVGGTVYKPCDYTAVSQSFNVINPDITSTRRVHTGIDVTGGNKKIYPIYAGKVARILLDGTAGNTWGNAVILEHTLKYGSSNIYFYSIYGHLASITCSVGDNVEPLTNQLGIMGSTGQSTGIHLHCGVFSSKDSGAPQINSGALSGAVGYTIESSPRNSHYIKDEFLGPFGYVYYNDALLDNTTTLVEFMREAGVLS